MISNEFDVIVNIGVMSLATSLWVRPHSACEKGMKGYILIANTCSLKYGTQCFYSSGITTKEVGILNLFNFD